MNKFGKGWQLKEGWGHLGKAWAAHVPAPLENPGCFKPQVSGISEKYLWAFALWSHGTSTCCGQVRRRGPEEQQTPPCPNPRNPFPWRCWAWQSSLQLSEQTAQTRANQQKTVEPKSCQPQERQWLGCKQASGTSKWKETEAGKS